MWTRKVGGMGLSYWLDVEKELGVPGPASVDRAGWMSTWEQVRRGGKEWVKQLREFWEVQDSGGGPDRELGVHSI